MSWYYEYRPYVSVAKRRATARREVEKRTKKGQSVAPVVIEGRKIATTFWGKSWCEHLESFSDYANRLPRGRTYVRNGSVVDLQITPGTVKALVSGSSLYTVTISIAALPGKTWTSIKSTCAGQVGSLVELLQGRLSQRVMDVVTQRDTGLFPKPGEITLSCSCPDWAVMCKHVAAVLYGVGARLDVQPELLFLLRKVDHLELLETAATSATVGSSRRRGKQTIAGADLEDVFGIEISSEPPAQEAEQVKARPASRRRKSSKAVPAAPKAPSPRRRDPAAKGTVPVPKAKRKKAAAKPARARSARRSTARTPGLDNASP